ncbi:hypothetical protein [Pseudonocardia sp. 73-21]|jgi:lipase chaperone LimK|uniref:hypothetical protein n=1 Tax=Pseudonocardia sp. 73-21 TaxID=1895809 RepID=UPI0026347230|nr:hypothetical protein [Pseudonocardia sp. 73-21]
MPVLVRLESDTVTVDGLRTALLQLIGSADVAARCADLRREQRDEGGVEQIEAATRP